MGFFSALLLSNSPKSNTTPSWTLPAFEKPGSLQKGLGPGRFQPRRPLNSKLAALHREEDVVIGPGKQMGREAPLKRNNRSEAFCLDLIQQPTFCNTPAWQSTLLSPASCSLYPLFFFSLDGGMFTNAHLFTWKQRSVKMTFFSCFYPYKTTN